MRVEDIERYLAKEMTSSEREAFEAEMVNHPSLLLDVRILACVIRKTHDVCQEIDMRALERLCRYKRLEDSHAYLYSPSEDLSHFAADSLAVGDEQYEMCCQAYSEEVFNQFDEEGPMLCISDIKSDQSLCDMVEEMMVDERGTSIYQIVRQCIIRYGKSYSGMKVYDWVELVCRYIKDAAGIDYIQPNEYFVCSEDEE